jgi:lysyl-tRNA synthetase class 1
MVYEWFTLDGEPLSSSSGNVITVDEVLDILEPEVFKYFFVKDPRKQRDFSVENVDQLVDEFDRFERRYFGEAEASEDEVELAERAYPMVVDEPREERVRIPYTFAAVLGMTDDPELREEIARREGHIPDDAPEWAVEGALARVERAQEWASLTNNEFNYELKRSEIPDVSFDDETAAALDELADFIAEGHDGDAIQSEIYETAKRNDIDIGEFFSAGYQLLFDDTEGPQLGTFIAKLDQEFVVERFHRNE